MTVLHDASRIDICVCTFRRPELVATLRSLQALTVPPGFKVSIIVADNDDFPSAKPLIGKVKSQSRRFPIRYVHCPARNISIARNACLDVSSADFVAFIDDDETASDLWLENLIRVAQDSGADAVLGPVRSVYRPDAPDWMRRGDFHSTRPVWVAGEIRTGYTCNVLLRMGAKSVRNLRFGLERGRSGGEDTEFFRQVHRAGGRIAFADDAWVVEPVPPPRATFGWLARRRFRMGQTHGKLLAAEVGGMRRLGEVALAAAKTTYSWGAAGLTVFRPVSRNRNALRGVMHAGAVSGLLGGRELQQYGALPAKGLATFTATIAEKSGTE
jgi:succinoglycan biosynthesis protein ExoM